MNKEILQKLADQAAVNDIVNNFNGEDYTVRMPSETWAREFAELIVRECLDIVNRKDYSYHEADPLWETAQLIKEHFGVNQ